MELNSVNCVHQEQHVQNVNRQNTTWMTMPNVLIVNQNHIVWFAMQQQTNVSNVMQTIIQLKIDVIIVQPSIVNNAVQQQEKVHHVWMDIIWIMENVCHVLRRMVRIVHSVKLLINAQNGQTTII